MQVDKDGEKGYYSIIMDDKLRNIFRITKFRQSADIENGCAVAVGGFDGVHIGHRAMIEALVCEAREKSLPAVVFTFDTDDSPKSDASLLATSCKKESLLCALGVDMVVSARFSEIRNMSAGDFVNGVLFAFLNAKSVVCGYDFRFGNKREGDVFLIKDILIPKGLNIITPEAVKASGEPVSSTLIRSLISSGDVERANLLLGRRFSFDGEIVHGKKLGRTLGFPTINQKYPICLAEMRYGVYAVICNIDGVAYGGVANVGLKPTVGCEEQPLCETYLFGFSGDCYGKTAETEFVAFIREEQKFDSLDELKRRVESDMDSAKNILKGVI